MKIKELRKLDITKLNEALTETRNQARELRFSIANNQLKAVRQLRAAKKEIARILTVLNEKRSESEAKTEEKTNEEKK